MSITYGKAVLDESQPCFMHTNYINGINRNTLEEAQHSVPRFTFRIMQTDRDPHKVSLLLHCALALTQQVSGLSSEHITPLVQRAVGHVSARFRPSDCEGRSM